MAKGRRNNLDIVFLAFTQAGKTIAYRVGRILEANSDSPASGQDAEQSYKDMGGRYLGKMKAEGLVVEGRRNCFGEIEYVLTDKGLKERQKREGKKSA